jgi:hypothetical protein
MPNSAKRIYLRIPIYPARYSDSNPATCSDPFPAIHSELMSAAV